MYHFKSLFLIASVLALSAIPGGSAGPACARKHQKAMNCMSLCASRWGWPGMAMGSDPWGSVLKPDASGQALQKACGTVIPPKETSTSQTYSSGELATASPENSNNYPTPTPATSSTTSTSTTKTHSKTPKAASTTSTSAKDENTTPPPSQPTPKSDSSSSNGSPKQNAANTKPSPSPAPAPAAAAAPPPADSGSNGGTSDSDINAYLTAHNTIRAQHGASPLTWSNNAAAKAQQWANGCVFKHSGGTLGPFGENLAAGTGSAYGIAAAVKSWTDEVSQYDPNNPEPSHFTQVVWKGSTQVGCAVQSCDGIFAASFGKAKFFVCEYSPQGNVIGEFAHNVQA
ncbi:PR-1-like protein [Rickenella mellea]|uniref:PR-1-like protein n=1 Tax=Rickenella mellea TaxID=50990 RepID=A0A4Y7QNN2_9AGAM|nr:PR-1-like protein [Rickenella mellea]